MQTIISQREKEMTAVCPVCPHACRIREGELGFCGARKNRDGRIIAENYGRVTALALDPIEKKPLRRFMPGSMILSAGSYGCNFRCGFCQNYHISMTAERKEEAPYSLLPPEALVSEALLAKERGNIGIAFTYNEPLIGYEYVLDTAKMAKKKDLKVVIVTNGYICEEPLMQLLPFVDAMNIDLKSFSEDFYRKIGGKLECVRNNIDRAAAHCHVEVTTLVIPGENDTEEEMEALSCWLSSVSEDIPLHISRFFPQFEMQDKMPTSPDKIYKLAEIAQKHLKYVYKGNL